MLAAVNPFVELPPADTDDVADDVTDDLAVAVKMFASPRNSAHHSVDGEK